jgi:hypothetical protein
MVSSDGILGVRNKLGINKHLDVSEAIVTPQSKVETDSDSLCWENKDEFQ